jgi:hypothetical protein
MPTHAVAVTKTTTEGELYWSFTLPSGWGTTPLSFGRETFVNEQLPGSWLGYEGRPTPWSPRSTDLSPHVFFFFFFFWGSVKDYIYTPRMPQCLAELRGCIQTFPDWVDNDIKAYNKKNTRWEATQMVMAPKLIRLTHKIATQLHLLAESCTICSSCSRRPVRKLLDTPSYEADIFLSILFPKLFSVPPSK